MDQVSWRDNRPVCPSCKTLLRDVRYTGSIGTGTCANGYTFHFKARIKKIEKEKPATKKQLKKLKMANLQYGPRCPNHHVALVNLPVPMVEKGTATCPISGASFDYEIELDKHEMRQDSQGNIIKAPKWKTEGEEK